MPRSAAGKSKNYQYDVCLSFAGEDRSYVGQVAKILANQGVRVFYDEYEKVELWGKDLYSHLDDVYQNAAKYCVIFISKSYAKKLWTNHERQSAQARAFKAHAEYLLPVRLDKTKIEGIRDTVGFIDAKNMPVSELADLIVQKVGLRQRESYFPPVPDRLFKALGAKTVSQKAGLKAVAQNFFEVLERMNKAERNILFEVVLQGCPAELPDNVHISLDLLRRILKTSPTKIIRTVSKTQSLGFSWKVRNSHGEDDREPNLVVEWDDMHIQTSGNFTIVMNEMISLAVDKYCHEHGRERLHNLDFAQLSTATESEDVH